MMFCTVCGAPIAPATAVLVDHGGVRHVNCSGRLPDPARPEPRRLVPLGAAA